MSENDDVFSVDGVDELFTVAPNEFVAKREALAKRLKAEGDKTAAAAVKKMPRPSVVAWAVNQVARRDRISVDALVRASAEVGDAQVDAVRGGDAAKLRNASRERRDVLQQLVDAASELAGATHRDEVAQTLEAASVDDDLAVLLRAGRLSVTLFPSSGFGLAGMLDVASNDDTPAMPAKPKPDDAKKKRAVLLLEQVQGDLETARDGVRRAEERVDNAMRALELARTQLNRASATKERAEAALQALEAGD